MTRELDEACALALGWIWVQHSSKQTTMRGYQGDNPRWLADPEWIKGLGDDPSWVIIPADMDVRIGANVDLPHYSTDPAAASELEDAIERRGKGAAYARALSTIIGMAYLDLEADSDAVNQELWRLLRAAPEQRAQAFLKVMSE